MIDRFRNLALPLLVEAEEILRRNRRGLIKGPASAWSPRYAISGPSMVPPVPVQLARHQPLQAPRRGTPKHDRSAEDIIDDEIQSTERVIHLTQKNPLRYFILSDYTGGEGYGPEFMEHLNKRVEVMRRHRGDPLPLFL